MERKKNITAYLTVICVEVVLELFSKVLLNFVRKLKKCLFCVYSECFDIFVYTFVFCFWSWVALELFEMIQVSSFD